MKTLVWSDEAEIFTYNTKHIKYKVEIFETDLMWYVRIQHRDKPGYIFGLKKIHYPELPWRDVLLVAQGYRSSTDIQVHNAKGEFLKEFKDYPCVTDRLMDSPHFYMDLYNTKELQKLREQHKNMRKNFKNLLQNFNLIKTELDKDIIIK